jgi:2-polyprenyl-3-methyl-5-hydroxy-6-metoxy-1,4-benzoquinol methylase
MGHDTSRGTRAKVVEANIAFYREEARRYADHRESDAFLDRYAARFDRHWHTIAPLLPPAPAALDCCAGHGLLTRLLSERGCRVTAVDVSPEMIGLLDLDGVELVCDEIGSFLESTDARWDLIAFGSALHHLWDYGDVLRAAGRRVAPGGLLYVVGEPIRQQGVAARGLRQAEIVARKVRRNPRDVPAAIRRRLQFERERQQPAVAPSGRTTGFYAEVHAFGLDWQEVMRALDGLEILFVERANTGSAPMQALKRLLPGYGADNFHLLARKPTD